MILDILNLIGNSPCLNNCHNESEKGKSPPISVEEMNNKNRFLFVNS